MRFLLPAGVFLVALVLVGCAGDRGGRGGGRRPAPVAPPPSDASRPVSVTGTDWVLVRLGGEAALSSSPPSARPWFHLDPSENGRVTGSTGVNVINGAYALSGGALQFGKLTTTRRAGPPELMRQEAGFLNALEKTATAELRGRSLVLRDAGRVALAEFNAVDVTP